MTNFRSKKVRGTTYPFDHLRPHQFEITINGTTYRVEVRYSCHVFTTARTDQTTPDLFYSHGGEDRAFCPDRYRQSLMLPNLIATHDGRNVYHSNQDSYFLVNNGTPNSYYVFFRAFKATKALKKKGVSVILDVRSAYEKQNNIRSAPAVKFTSLVEAIAQGRTLRRGQDVPVRQRN